MASGRLGSGLRSRPVESDRPDSFGEHLGGGAGRPTGDATLVRRSPLAKPRLLNSF